MPNKNALRLFWDAATPAQREAVATSAGTKAIYLYRLLTPATRRRLNLVTAIALGEATRKLSVRTKGRVPEVTVFDLAAMYGAEK